MRSRRSDGSEVWIGDRIFLQGLLQAGDLGGDLGFGVLRTRERPTEQEQGDEQVDKTKLSAHLTVHLKTVIGAIGKHSQRNPQDRVETKAKIRMA